MASKKDISSVEPKQVLVGLERGAEGSRLSSKLESEENTTDSSGQNSPRGVLEIPISSVHSDAGSSSESSFSDRLVSPYGVVTEQHSSQWRSLISGLLTRRKKSIMRLSTFPPAIKASCLERKNEGLSMGGLAKLDIPVKRPSWRNFDYQELVAATDNFSHEKLIGKGGHAEVYKGFLPDGQLVAVKRLIKKEMEEERISDFLSELGIIAHVNHPNAAQLIGFCIERGLHLVLQFSPHGSLASVLHGSKQSLKWKNRFDIAVGIAEGLLYLHEECERRIIHRDIKASNVLLNEDYQPQISDFGLAKWLPENWTHHVVFPIEGTFGYMAPEYFMHGVVNEKTDVFAFGVLLLELITGRRAVDSVRKSLVIWVSFYPAYSSLCFLIKLRLAYLRFEPRQGIPYQAKPFLDSNDYDGLINPSLEEISATGKLTVAILVASMCIRHVATSRPTMSTVVQLLRGEVGAQEAMSRDSMLKPVVVDAGEFEDYTCSRYLIDLHRHKQLAMEQ